MTSIRTLVRTGLVLLAIVSLSPLSSAQEFPESQLEAARRAASSAPLSKDLDTVLPLLVQRVQTRLITLRPDLHAEITETVQGVALDLVARRADLDNTVATAWARMFTEEELDEIAAFYSSPVGEKFVQMSPELGAITIQIVDNWSSRVVSELLDKSREELKKQGHEL